MAEPVLCPVMPELVEVLRQPGGWVTSKPVRIWLAPDNVLCVEELGDEAIPEYGSHAFDAGDVYEDRG